MRHNPAAPGWGRSWLPRCCAGLTSAQARSACRVAEAPVTTHGEHRSTVYTMRHQFTTFSSIHLSIQRKCLSCNQKKNLQILFVQFNLKKRNMRTFTKSHALAQLIRSVCPAHRRVNLDSIARPLTNTFRMLQARRLGMSVRQMARPPQAGRTLSSPGSGVLAGPSTSGRIRAPHPLRANGSAGNDRSSICNRKSGRSRSGSRAVSLFMASVLRYP